MSYNPPVPGTGITAVAGPQLWSVRVFYQLLDDHVDQSVHQGGVWNKEELQTSPVSASPLASISWNDGKEVRVYYLDFNYIVQELCYTEGKGWYQGEIGQMKAQATPAAGLAAAVYQNENHLYLYVYYQEPVTNVVAALVNNGHWNKGKLRLSGALGGTSLAAVAYHQGEEQIRLYYQAADLSLKEHCHDSKGWHPGSFNPGKATARTPISAINFRLLAGRSSIVNLPPIEIVHIQVYWRDLNGFTVLSQNSGNWSPPSVIPAVGRGYEFSVVQWDNLRYLRLYYQNHAGAVHELCSDDGGRSWYPGQVLAVTVENVLQYLTN